MAEVASISILLQAQDLATPNLTKVSDEVKQMGGLTLGGLTGAIGGAITRLGEFGLASIGLEAVANAFEHLTSQAVEHQNIAAQTAAVLTSTGGAAGYSAQEVEDYANAMSLVAPYEDEAIQGAENILLTFTRIGGDIMPQATEAVLNISTALHQNLQNSAIQVGKALNDPVQGMQALRRVGVQLTSDQQELIKSMMQQGNVAGAQAVILRELQTEFGGSARAAGDTFAGRLAILNTQLGNLREAAFTPLLGVAGLLATALTQAAIGLQNAFGLIPGLVGAATNFMNEHRLALIAVGSVMITMMLPALQALAVAFTVQALSAARAAAATVAAWAAAAGPALAIILAVATAAVLLEEAWRNNFGGLRDIVQSVLGFVQDRIADFLDFIAGVLSRFGIEFNWRQMLETATAGTEAVLGNVGGVASGGLDKLKELMTIKGYDSGKGLGEGIEAGVEDTVSETIKKAQTDAQRVGEVIQQRMTVLQRESLDLKVAEAAAQAELIPLKQQEADLNLQLTETSQKRMETELQTVAARERLLGLTTSQAAEDLSYEQRRLQLKIQADALSGRGVAAEDVAQLTRLALQKPQVELAALEAGRPQTLAERDLTRFQLERQIAQAPIQENQADLQVEIARRQREIDAINAQKQAAQLSLAPELADLEAKKRQLDDAQFVAKQQLADLNRGKTAGNIQLHIEQHINAEGQIDYDAILDSTLEGVQQGLANAQKASQNAASNNFVPGARLPFGGPF